jgi:hypothetical protein
MKKIKKIIFLFALSFLPLPLANAAVENQQLVDMFSVESEPGEGTLEFGTKKEDMEKISLGAVSGHYGLAVIFPGKMLPPPYNKDFKNQHVIQLAIGTLKSKLENRVPQFGAGTFIAKRVPTAVTTFNFIVPSEKKKHGANTALLLFTSPNSPADQKDEEKLQKTFFGKEGSIRITPIGTVKSISVKGENASVTFRKQLMKLEFQGALKTPFSDSEKSLTGTIQLPFFWPQNKEAEKLTRRLAAQSMNPPGVPSSPPHK